MYQFDEGRDRRLNECEARLAGIDTEREALQREHDETWVLVMDLMGALAVPGNVRFICDDGFVLAKEERRGAVTIDVVQLEDLVLKRYTAAEAERIWRRVTTVKTERVLDQAKLARAVEQGLIDPAIVQVSTLPGKVTVARVRRQASKADREALARGVITVPEGQVADVA